MFTRKVVIPQKKKYAVFDFDGTLSRGFISMEFLDYVHQRGLYDDREYQHQMDILQQYREGRLSYDDWVFDWGLTWARGLKGKGKIQVNNCAREFFEGFKNNIYPQAGTIMNYLWAQGLVTVLLSAGVFEVVDLARRSLGMDLTLATRCQIKYGTYTGTLITSVHTPSGKGKAVERLMSTWGRPEYAFGDSSGDIAMLQRARIPVCLNPSAELTEIADKKSWVHIPITDAPTLLKHQFRLLEVPAVAEGSTPS